MARAANAEADLKELEVMEASRKIYDNASTRQIRIHTSDTESPDLSPDEVLGMLVDELRSKYDGDIDVKVVEAAMRRKLGWKRKRI